MNAPMRTLRSRGLAVGAAVLVWVAASPFPGRAFAMPSQAVCAARVNDTAAKLVACVQQDALWKHMIAFQRIADQNPGSDGHGNRDTGTSGYKASVDYVARLVRAAGYKVTVQPYSYARFSLAGAPAFRTGTRSFAYEREWYVARLSGSGAVTAPVQPVGATAVPAIADARSGCLPNDYAGFAPGHIALLQRGPCSLDEQAAAARAAGAAAVIVYNEPDPYGAVSEQGRGGKHQGGAYQGNLTAAAGIAVLAVVSNAVGEGLLAQYAAGRAPTVHLDVSARYGTGIDYNLIAESPLGDPNAVVVVEGHLDAIYGAGMLDNASGSTTILELALQIAKTQTRNRLRFIWFGGEELGLLGSRYYTTHLTAKELSRIVFDIDSDVTATPNYDIQIADPADAHNASRFPSNVVPASRIGTKDFDRYFSSIGMVSRAAPFGNDGTDSNSFALVGVPDTGILTEQDCCKQKWEVDIWGGVPGNYEGNIPSHDGGCVDQPHRWCDNLSNNDPHLLEVVSKAFAYVAYEIANRVFPRRP